MATATGDRFPFSTAALRATLQRVIAEDAASSPLLDEDTRRALLAATADLAWRPARPVVGKGPRIVRQEFEICLDVPRSSLLWRFAHDLGAALDAALTSMRPPPLAAPLRLNDLVVQRYAPGALGMTAHRDHIRYVALVALVVLAGRGRFCVCTDRAGRAAREIPAPPGHLLLMRAPGLAGRTDRPFHFVDRIIETRVVLGLRQEAARQAGTG